MTQIRGWHVFATFALAFSVIIGVNLALAYSAMRTFPGLEVRNSYVASQSFDVDRKAQNALGWEVSARLEGAELVLSFQHDGLPVAPVIEQAIFGRATVVTADQTPEFIFDGKAFRAEVRAKSGNWNLRLRARAADGTLFQQRIIVRRAS